MQSIQSRRDFLTAAASAGAAGVLGVRTALADDGPPEVTTIRLSYLPAYACVTPHSIAEQLLRAEGFAHVEYLPQSHDYGVARGEIDFDVNTAAWLVSQVDAGDLITVLAGIHVGCYELFVHEPIRTIADLRGKKVGIDYVDSSGHLHLMIMAAQVGLDPKKDIEWVANPPDWAANPDSALLGGSQQGRSMLSSRFRPSRRNCERARSVE